MTRHSSKHLPWALSLVLSLFAAPAGAAPVDKALGFQEPATQIMRRIEGFHNNIMLPMCIIIVSFVLVLLLWVMLRYSARNNPNAKSFTHNTLLEVVWTAVPVAILVGLALISLPLLADEDTIPAKVDLTLKVTGSQWYWDYEYPDYGGMTFTSKVLSKAEAEAAQKPYLLAVNNPVYVPVNKVVKVIITAADVIHSWSVPSFGIKKDAVPGRLNAVWFKADKEGVYYGQCSQLCGADHAFMPIEVHVVSDAEFAAWMNGMKKKFGANDAPHAVYAAGAEIR
jgi:cytochrome c oxidase subunit II